MTTPLFPVFLKLKRTPCLVVGGGAVAERKVRSLLKAGASVVLTAPRITNHLREWVDQGRIQWRQKEYSRDELVDAQFVFAATDDPSLNKTVSQHCQDRRTPVNVADAPDLCSFHMPAVVDRFPLQIAISTNGASPLLARILRTRLELLFPSSYSRLAALLGRLRPWAKDRIPDAKARMSFWQRLLDSPEAQRVLESQTAAFDLDSLHALAETHANARPRPGKVYLVGAGPGDPELLTLKAMRLMQQVDVVVHDHLVTNDILACARGDAERISVGKSRGCHSFQQTEINDLLVRLASEGKQVLRLKGGDPFVFGRGGEEAEALNRAGILFEVVPGITAALGCAASLGIPLTHRRMAHSLVLMTGHFCGENDEYDWRRLCQPGQTLAIYMGLANLHHLSDKLKLNGMRGTMPAALVQEGTTRNQKSVIGTVEELPRMAERGKFASPVLVIIGEVVQLHDLHRMQPHHFESDSKKVAHWLIPQNQEQNRERYQEKFRRSHRTYANT